MTISTTTIKNSYSGNGSTTTFNYTFKITDQDDIDVIIRSSSLVNLLKIHLKVMLVRRNNDNKYNDD